MNHPFHPKHYYFEGERVCSKLGNGFGHALTEPCNNALTSLNNQSPDQIASDLWMMVLRGADCSKFDTANITIHHSLEPPCSGDNLSLEKDQYFYHSDHLGSSSFITDFFGDAIQHLQYLPYGETFVDQQTGQWNTPYKFSGKEKDDETGYSYFGARYYDSDLSVWLSVDPLASKAPSWSPYNAMWGNPVLNIDLDGRWAGDYFKTDGTYLGKDGIKDNKIYTVTGIKKNSLTKKECLQLKEIYDNENSGKTITFHPGGSLTLPTVDLLSLDKDQLLNRAKWIYGESQTGVTSDGTPVSDYYAWTIKNLRNKVSSEEGLYAHMKTTSGSLYDEFLSGGYNEHQKKFDVAMKSDLSNLFSSIPHAQQIVGSIIEAEISSRPDPTNGAFGWIGGESPGRKNLTGERYKTSVIIHTTDNYYHYFHRYK